MTLFKLFYFTNFFSCLFKKRRNSFAALVAGIKVFGPRKIGYVHAYSPIPNPIRTLAEDEMRDI